MTITPRDTRRALLDAAAAEFATHGAHGARIHAIVKRSGVNERMVYHHFGSKAGLYRAVLKDQWTDLGGAWQRALAHTDRLEPRDGLRRAFRAFFDVLADRPMIVPLAIHESLTGWRAVPRATLAQVPREVRTLYSRGQRTGVFRRDRSFYTFYLTIVGALTGLKLLAPRFADLRGGRQQLPAVAEKATHVIDIVLDGVSVGDVSTERKRT